MAPSLAAAAVDAAQSFGISGGLLLTTLLEESQFYHGTASERFWTRLFLLGTLLPISRLRCKSLGIASIKPLTGAELLAAELESSVPRRHVARILSMDHYLSIRLAARHLATFRERGAADDTAFLCYAATPATTERLLNHKCATLVEEAAFFLRLRRYGEHQPAVHKLLLRTTAGLDGKGPAVVRRPERYPGSAS